MRRAYLIYSFIGFVVYWVLSSMNTQLRYIALGFGVVMLLFSIAVDNTKMVNKVENLNKLEGGQKNGI